MDEKGKLIEGNKFRIGKYSSENNIVSFSLFKTDFWRLMCTISETNLLYVYTHIKQSFI